MKISDNIREMHNRGYNRLWASVIIQAATDIEHGRRERYYHYKALKKGGLQLTFDSWRDSNTADFTYGALHWILSDEDRLGSFSWICDQVGLDMRKIREICLDPEKRKTLLKSSLRPTLENYDVEDEEEAQKEGAAVDPALGRELVQD